jgi:hypothetical protein
MRYLVRTILGGLAATLMLAGVGIAATATAANAKPAPIVLASAFHPIKNTGTGMCLQPEFGSPVEFANIVQMPCNRDNASQGWLEQRVGSHHYMFLNQSSGYCFDAFDGAFNGARLLQGTCVRISNEEYNTNVDLPNIAIIESRVRFRDTGFCVDVPGGQPVVGAAMRIWVCNGSPAQRWIIGFDV